VSAYTAEMFAEDYRMVVPLIMKYRDLESLDEKKDEAQPEDAFMEIVACFMDKYGNVKGSDYQMRFLSIMQFIEHYAKELRQESLISEVPSVNVSISNDLLNFLLDSFKDPQPPSPYPSSSLHNQYHEFNYKKVLKTIKLKFKE
jgi:hypothetical protein